MKKIIFTFLMGFSACSFANNPPSESEIDQLDNPHTTINKPNNNSTNQSNNTNSENNTSKKTATIVEPKIISSENFFITKYYDESNVPADLKKWVPWVNKNNYTKDCIDSICVFIPKLTMTTTSDYVFTFEGTSLSRHSWLPLPASEHVWPLGVLINGQKAVIVSHNGKPFIEVSQKDFKVEAHYKKTIFEKSSSFELPFNIVSFDNKTGQNLSLKENVISLNDISTTQDKNNFQEIKVFRKFTDNIPYNLDTNIQINFSGKTKEFDLGEVLPKDFKLTQINSDLKVIFKNNHYYINLIPGTHFVHFKSFANKEIASFSIKNLIHDTENEVWSFEKNTNLRNIDISSANIVDPKQANVPEEWSKLPAYLVADTLELHTSQQGLSFNNDLKINAQRQSIFGFNDTVYSLDQVNLENQYTKQLTFNSGIYLQSISLAQPKMILKEQNQHYILLNSHDKSGIISFDTKKGQPIPSQLNPFYYVDNWKVFFTPRTQLIWASHAKITSSDFWFNAWNLYSLFSLSVLIIALYKLIGKEAAMLALFSLFSFYYNNSVFWIFWILLVISYAFNRYLPEKYQTFKRNTNTISLIGTALVVIFAIEFVINEIFSIIHPNVSTPLHFSPLSYIGFMIVFGLIYKIVSKIIYKKQKNNPNANHSWRIWFVIGLLCLSLPYFFSVSKNTTVGAGASSSGILTSTIRNIDDLDTQQSVQVDANPENVKDISVDSNNAPNSLEKAETLDEIAHNQDLMEKSVQANKTLVPSAMESKRSIERDISQEKVQIGHAAIDIATLHGYELKPSNKEPVQFYVAPKWLVNIYGVIQSLFLLLFAYILVMYNVLLFKKEHLLTTLPHWFYHNVFTKKIQSKINEASV